jgi:hypothetical protein
MYNDRQSGLQAIDVKAILELNEEVKVEFGDIIEVSLDCSICLARGRTVEVYENQEYGICIKAKHQFTIKINSKLCKVKNNLVEVVYQIEYWYLPFCDPKYNKESQCLPTWGRIHFTITCPNCLRKIKNSLQTNTVRPFSRLCNCGFRLYTENDVMPIIEKI